MPTAMVIDDSRAMRMILTRELNKLGYQVCSAENGREALTYLESEAPELALFLVDWNMPEMDGLSFISLVRKLPRYASTPLMMVTTEVEVSQIQRALEAGANEYVMKPFTEDVIAGKLEMLGLL